MLLINKKKETKFHVLDIKTYMLYLVHFHRKLFGSFFNFQKTIEPEKYIATFREKGNVNIECKTKKFT